jgi:hypothetical protein
MKGVQMNRARKLTVGIVLMGVLGIPGAAVASGGQNCVGETAQMFKAAMRFVAQEGPGAVGEYLGAIREDPDAYPWCTG